jgi:mersacidin/lichenicidin family type 2 lantibiotic
MSIQDIIRAWKDAEYRESLNQHQRALLPEHPAGLIELTDADIGLVAGAAFEHSFVCSYVSECCTYTCDTEPICC